MAAAGLAAVYAGDGLGLPPLLTATLAVAGLALASGALHLDGLADTADGFVVPGGRERRLEVMRRGDVGPAGVAVLVFVLLRRSARWPACSRGTRRDDRRGTLVLGVAVSRAGLALACVRGFPRARADGLGSGVAGTVPPPGPSRSGVLVAVVAYAVHGVRGVAGVLAAASPSARCCWLLAGSSVESPETCWVRASRSP